MREAREVSVGIDEVKWSMVSVDPLCDETVVSIGPDEKGIGPVYTYTVRDNKVYDSDGDVGVAVSLGYGAGWSTWDDVKASDARFIVLILNAMWCKEYCEGGKDAKGYTEEDYWNAAERLAEKLGYYAGGLRDCVIKWVPVGTLYRVDEYDGAESLEILDIDEDWERA